MFLGQGKVAGKASAINMRQTTDFFHVLLRSHGVPTPQPTPTSTGHFALGAQLAADHETMLSPMEQGLFYSLEISGTCLSEMGDGVQAPRMDAAEWFQSAQVQLLGT